MDSQDLPKRGTQMWHVREHFYYNADHMVEQEYTVCDAVVTGYITRGYTEIRLTGNNPDGYKTPYYYPVAQIGRRLFTNRQDAIQYAERLTDTMERSHLWQIGKSVNAHMRRPWR